MEAINEIGIRENGMKILFCGTMVPETIEYQIKNISAAGNRFQNNMINNLKSLGHKVDTVSYIAVNIPKALRDELLEEEFCDSNGEIKNHYIYRKNDGCKATFQAVRQCKETVQSLIQEYDVIFCYNIFYSFLFLPKLAQRFEKKSILILADYSGPESFYNQKSKLYARMQKWVMCQYDIVVGLSANVQKYLNPEQRFILMEGGIDEGLYNRFAERSKHAGDKVVFMYSGLLSKVTGVDILLQAIMRMKEEGFTLWISGKGDLEQQVRDAAEKDDRICYLGHMEYDEYIETLKKVDVLINPRNMEFPENQNNFPSKIMDYLATGKEIISSKFVGWEKFADNIVFYDDLNMLEKEIKMFLNEKTITKDVYEKNRATAHDYLWKNQLNGILEKL